MPGGLMPECRHHDEHHPRLANNPDPEPCRYMKTTRAQPIAHSEARNSTRRVGTTD